MKREPKKLEKVVMPVYCTKAFRDAVQGQAKKEARDVSKLVRMLLRERYKDLPEE